MSYTDSTLASLLTQFGIDPSAVSANPTQQDTPFYSGAQATGKIYTGPKKTSSTTGYTTTDPTKLRGDINATTGGPITTTKVEDTYDSVEGQLGTFYNMTPQQRRDVQQQMFVGGFYSPSVNAEDIAWGLPDENSYSAFTKAVSRAALLNQAGQKITLNEVLQQAAATDIGEIQRQKAAGQGPRVVVSDPASLALLASSTAQKVLGRKATQDEQRAIIAAVQSAQAAYSTGGSAMAPSPDATAENMLREKNGAEAGAHDFAGVFGDFLKMSQGGVQ